MVSALVPGANGPGSSPVGDTVLCSCARHLTLTVLSPPRSINGYRQIVGENLTNCGGTTCDGLASRPRGVEILLAASYYNEASRFIM